MRTFAKRQAPLSWPRPEEPAKRASRRTLQTAPACTLERPSRRVACRDAPQDEGGVETASLAVTAVAKRLALTLAASLAPAAAWAQIAHRPFAVGGGEGGGGAEGGIVGFLLAEQSRLTHMMANDVHALHADPSALWGLVGLGLAYGVFHAAGPGHGKAVIASYMVANESSLKRGAVMALLAALLQALVAIVLVGAAAIVLNATSAQMNTAADWLSIASAAGVAGLGLWLSWRKGRALLAALQPFASSAPAP